MPDRPDTCPKCEHLLPPLQPWVSGQTVNCQRCECTVMMTRLADPKVLWDPSFAEAHELKRSDSAPTDA